MKRTKILFASLLILLYTGCTHESSLSNVYIDNPALISPEINMERTIAADGTITYRTEVWLKDNTDSVAYPDSADIMQRMALWVASKLNKSYMTLKGGGITVNGVAMDTARSKELYDLHHYTPRYSTSAVNLKPNTDYVFVIQFYNGTSYENKITTPQYEVSELITPDTYVCGEALAVSWKDEVGYDDVDLDYMIDKTKGQYYSMLPISSEERKAGSVVMRLDTLQALDIEMIKLTLNATKRYPIHTAFSKGGSFYLKYRVEKNIECK